MKLFITVTNKTCWEPQSITSIHQSFFLFYGPVNLSSKTMKSKRNFLILFQAVALVFVPLFLEISWSRQVHGILPSAKFVFGSQLFPHTETSTIASDLSSSPFRSNNVNERSKPDSLRIAWLMSFPNSGTTYTSHFIRKTTRTKTATNYAELRLSRQVLLGQENKESIPILEDQPSGPFWNDGIETEPASGYVLTKTHCGALCMWCPPEKYTQMFHHFRHRCLRSDKMSVINGTKMITKGAYPPTRVDKAVHLIRDPLDNVVSRFRYERVNGRSAIEFNSTREEFRMYCENMNREFLPDVKRGRYIEPDIRKLIEKVPCFTEFLKWVEWHNFAFIATEELELDTFVLHYEDYSTKFDGVTSDLLAFLHLERIADPPVFQAFKEYKDYFTQEEREVVAVAIRFMALRKTWSHVSRYFI